MKARPVKKERNFQNLMIPLIAIALSFLLGGIIMLISGNNPITGYMALIKGMIGDWYFLGETLQTMTPLILSGLAVAFAYKTGLFNIGVEGQLIFGWLASVYVGIILDLPTMLHLPLSILAGVLAGALYAIIPGLLKAYFRIHEVIVTIMLNYIALHVSNHIIRSYLLDSAQRTAYVKDSASLHSEFLYTFTNFSRLNWGIIIAILGCFIMWYVMKKTTIGLELRAVGLNRDASLYSGMSVNKNIVLSMGVSGAFAGAAGVALGLGTYGYANILSYFTMVGFDGIGVALLGNSSPIGIFFSAFLLGGFKSGSSNMQSSAGIAPEIIDIIIALVIFFVASGYIIRLLMNYLKSKKEGNING